MTEASAWDDYLERGRRYVATGQLGTVELKYKHEAARDLRSVRDAVLSGNGNWLDLLRKIGHFGNLCGWRGRDDLLKWFKKDPDGASDVLREFWAHDEQSVAERIRHFASRMPQYVIKGRGTRMRPISFLLMALDAERYPPFMKTVFDNSYHLTGYPTPLIGRGRGGTV